ncbi:MAG: redox-sensitive transcriptional activator SoxR [Pseudomonadota bacterium]
MADPEITITTLGRRTGLAASALRFYEERGLLLAGRTRGGSRRFRRSDIRRVSFIRILQQFGFSLARIAEILAQLPERRTPTEADWRNIAEGLREDIDSRIATLERMRDSLDGCIGCGCLSLKRCALYNPKDKAGRSGPGARYLMGERPSG